MSERPIVFAGGGTGGHVFPGLAVARALRERVPEHPIEWIGTAGGLEERLVPRAGFPLRVLPLAGAARRGALQKLRAAVLALAGTFRCAWRFAGRRPVLLVGVGGFASGPAVLAALLLGVPTLLLEQNAFPGATNRMLSRFADATAVAFAEAGEHLAGRVVVTGNPVRPEILAIAPRVERPVRRVLAFGGSRGAHSLNEAWCEAVPRLADLPLELTLQTGPDDHGRVVRALADAPLRCEIRPFLDDLPRRLADADLVVSRAGATTVAELTAAGRAAILVPYPHAAGDHQRANARTLAAHGAAVVIDPLELTGEHLADTVRRLVLDPARVQRMAEAARALGRRDATGRVVELALGILPGRTR